MANNDARQGTRHWVTAMTLAIFVGALLGVRWVVKTQRAPGSVTVVEAQSMDMKGMKAPQGVFPVSVENASLHDLSDSLTFPAQAVSFSDEEVVARVPGRVLWTVYPGDHVQAGAVVAKIEADEFAIQGQQASAMASANTALGAASIDEVSSERSVLRRYQADADEMEASVEKAKADQAVAAADQSEKAQDVVAKQAAVADAKAKVAYLELDATRQEKLYAEGVVSLDRYQRSQADAKSGAARVAMAEADVTAASAAERAGAARFEAAKRGVIEAEARLRSAKSRTEESGNAISKASHDAKAKQDEAKAAKSAAKEAQVISGYRELRALNDAMVAERFVSPGGIVASGQRLLMLHVADPIRIQASVPQDEAGRVQIGAHVSIEIGGLTRVARVTSIFPQSDATTRTVLVEALVKNAEHSILPGAFGSMQIEIGAAKQGVAVRNEAVQTDAGGAKFVWVAIAKPGGGTVTDWTCAMHPQVSEPGPGKCPICSMPLVPRTKNGNLMASRRSIVTGGSSGEYTSVSQGLRAGDQVIWKGFENLIEGSAIEQEGSKSAPPKAPNPGSDAMPGMDMGPSGAKQ